jgi:hypothetical protein
MAEVEQELLEYVRCRPPGDGTFIAEEWWIYLTNSGELEDEYLVADTDYDKQMAYWAAKAAGTVKEDEDETKELAKIFKLNDFSNAKLPASLERYGNIFAVSTQAPPAAAFKFTNAQTNPAAATQAKRTAPATDKSAKRRRQQKVELDDDDELQMVDDADSDSDGDSDGDMRVAPVAAKSATADYKADTLEYEDDDTADAAHAAGTGADTQSGRDVIKQADDSTLLQQNIPYPSENDISALFAWLSDIQWRLGEDGPMSKDAVFHKDKQGAAKYNRGQVLAFYNTMLALAVPLANTFTERFSTNLGGTTKEKITFAFDVISRGYETYMNIVGNVEENASALQFIYDQSQMSAVSLYETLRTLPAHHEQTRY